MYSIVYTTVASQEDAQNVAKELIQRKLIACANAFKMRSTYCWEGEITSEKEVAVLLKTKKALVDDVIDVLTEIHPYELPCALELPIKNGSRPYLNWIDSQTTQPK